MDRDGVAARGPVPSASLGAVSRSTHNAEMRRRMPASPRHGRNHMANNPATVLVVTADGALVGQLRRLLGGPTTGRPLMFGQATTLANALKDLGRARVDLVLLDPATVSERNARDALRAA